MNNERIKEEFIRPLMPNYSDEDVQQAMVNYTRFIELVIKTRLRKGLTNIDDP